MFHCEAKKIGLLANQMTSCGSNRDRLRRNHFANHTADAFAATVTTGSTPMDVAVADCNFPNNALAEVSDPVMNTPNHPSTGAKKGNKFPVLASACAMVMVMPESLTM
jgi:hypothetical protein